MFCVEFLSSIFPKNQQYILTDGRYTAAVKTLIPDFKLIEISSKFSFEKALKNLTKKHKIKKVGFEGKNISFLEHKKLLTTVGLKGMVVVNTKDAIIVVPKDKVKDITELVAALKRDGYKEYL